ncbi:helix-turn-helix domain-containing protein [Shimia sp. W99]
MSASNTIPLIRAGAVFPILHWIRANGLDRTQLLGSADLNWIDDTNPFSVIPLRNAALLLRKLSEEFGPDAPWRVASDLGFFELGLLARLTLTSRTPRHLFASTAELLPYHCSHETLQLSEERGFLRLMEGWFLRFDEDETLHAVQQYCVAMIESVLSASGPVAPSMRRILMVPHPQFGLSHLSGYLGDSVSPSPTRALEIWIADELADKAMVQDHVVDGANSVFDQYELTSLRSDGKLSGAVKLLLKQMLKDGKPSIDRIAFAAGISRRSLQRQLDCEGQTFSKILEMTRIEEAEQKLATGGSLASISQALGYADPASFTRGMKRWTGQSPSEFRKERTIIKQ